MFAIFKILAYLSSLFFLPNAPQSYFTISLLNIEDFSAVYAVSRIFGLFSRTPLMKDFNYSGKSKNSSFLKPFQTSFF